MNGRAVVLALLAMLLMAVSGMAQDYPKPKGFVNDYAGVMGAGEIRRLETIAQKIRQKAQIELAFVIMDSIPEGQDISLYAVELGHHWGVGSKGDRGALLLYNTGRVHGNRQVYLATGYGLEGDIPDARAGQILDEVTIPRLKMGKVYEGFLATAAVIVQRVAPDVQLTGELPRVQMQSRGQDEGPGVLGLIIMIVFIVIMSSSRFGRGMLFGMLLGNLFGGHRGHWGGGGGFGGGGFGGGFGGFGGGGFGGGGAGRGF